VFLTNAGALISCQGGFWASWPYAQFVGTGAPINMTGADVPVLSATLPALPQSACWRVSYGVGALSNATIKLVVDGTITISQPLPTGEAGAPAGLAFTGIFYCNLGSRTTQVLYYDFTGAPNPLASAAGIDSWVNTPPSVDWSLPHVLSVTVNQASGTVTGQYLRISGGF